MKLSPGSIVRLKADPGRAGVMLEGERAAAGKRMVEVQFFADGHVRMVPLVALEAVPSTPETMLQRFSSGRFVEPEALRRTLTRLRVTGRLSEVVYSMEATETDFYAYQFKPVVKLMNSPTDAMLVADVISPH